jgi:hypothetical protein
MPPRGKGGDPDHTEGWRIYAEVLREGLDAVLTLYPRVANSPFCRHTGVPQRIARIESLGRDLGRQRIMSEFEVVACARQLELALVAIANAIESVVRELPMRLEDPRWLAMLHRKYNDSNREFWQWHLALQEGALRSLREHIDLYELITAMVRKAPTGWPENVRSLPDVSELISSLEEQCAADRQQLIDIDSAMDTDPPAPRARVPVTTPAVSGLAPDIPTHPALVEYAAQLLDAHGQVESHIERVLLFGAGALGAQPSRGVSMLDGAGVEDILGHQEGTRQSARLLTEALSTGNHQLVLHWVEHLATFQRRMCLAIRDWWKQCSAHAAGGDSRALMTLAPAVDAVLDELGRIQQVPVPGFLATGVQWRWYRERLSEMPAQTIRRTVTEILQAPGLLDEWAPPDGLDAAILTFEAAPQSYSDAKVLHRRYAALIEGLVSCLWQCQAGCQEWQDVQPSDVDLNLDDDAGPRLREHVETTVRAVEAAGSLLDLLGPVLSDAPDELNWSMPEVPDLMDVIYAVRRVAPPSSALRNPAWHDVTEAS